MIILVIVLALIQEPLDFRHQDVPAPFQGTWALDAAACRDPGPAVVTISPRRIDFHEKHALLDIGRLNQISDPPEFWGRFAVVDGFEFYDETIRLNLSGGKLIITEGAKSNEAMSTFKWTRCGL